MPAASWRTRPARTMSLWLMASASAGSSRSVGMSDRLQRIRLFRAGDFVGAGDARVVDQALDGLTAQDVGIENLGDVGLLHPRVPHVVRIDDDHGAVAALREAAGLVDPHLRVLAGRRGSGAERLDVLLDVTLLGTRLARGAHEHVAAVLAHGTPVSGRSGG